MVSFGFSIGFAQNTFHLTPPSAVGGTPTHSIGSGVNQYLQIDLNL